MIFLPLFLFDSGLTEIERQAGDGLIQAFGNAYLAALFGLFFVIAFMLILGLNFEVMAVLLIPFIFVLVSTGSGDAGFGGFHELQGVVYLGVAAIVTLAVLKYWRK